MGIFNKLEVTVLPQTYFTTEEKAIARNNIDAIEDAPTSSTYVRTSGSWVELNGANYSAGPNIDITNNIISSKDWTPELNTKLDSTAFTLPTSSDWTKAYETVTANSASWDDVSAKLNTTAFSTVSGNFLTAIPDEYSTKDYVQSSVSSKLDSTAFSTVSGSFLTAHQTLEGYATTGDVESAVSSKLDTTVFSTASGSFLTAHQDLSDYATTVELADKLDTTAFSDVSGSFLTAHQDISNLMPKSESANFYPMTGNPSSFLTAHQDLSNYATTASVAEKLDTTAFSTVSGNFLTANALEEFLLEEAVTFYLDMTNGDDSNSGLSRSKPMKTVAAVVALARSMAEGDYLVSKYRLTILGEGETISFNGETLTNTVLFETSSIVSDPHVPESVFLPFQVITSEDRAASLIFANGIRIAGDVLFIECNGSVTIATMSSLSVEGDVYVKAKNLTVTNGSLLHAGNGNVYVKAKNLTVTNAGELNTSTNGNIYVTAENCTLTNGGCFSGSVDVIIDVSDTVEMSNGGEIAFFGDIVVNAKNIKLLTSCKISSHGHGSRYFRALEDLTMENTSCSLGADDGGITDVEAGNNILIRNLNNWPVSTGSTYPFNMRAGNDITIHTTVGLYNSKGNNIVAGGTVRIADTVIPYGANITARNITDVIDDDIKGGLVVGELLDTAMRWEASDTIELYATIVANNNQSAGCYFKAYQMTIGGNYFRISGDVFLESHILHAGYITNGSVSQDYPLSVNTNLTVKTAILTHNHEYYANMDGYINIVEVTEDSRKNRVQVTADLITEDVQIAISGLFDAIIEANKIISTQEFHLNLEECEQNGCDRRVIDKSRLLDADGWSVEELLQEEAVTLYLDIANGDDTNSGLSRSKPMKTVAAVVALARSMAEGDYLVSKYRLTILGEGETISFDGVTHTNTVLFSAPDFSSDPYVPESSYLPFQVITSEDRATSLIFTDGLRITGDVLFIGCNGSVTVKSGASLSVSGNVYVKAKNLTLFNSSSIGGGADTIVDVLDTFEMRGSGGINCSGDIVVNAKNIKLLNGHQISNEGSRYFRALKDLTMEWSTSHLDAATGITDIDAGNNILIRYMTGGNVSNGTTYPFNMRAGNDITIHTTDWPSNSKENNIVAGGTVRIAITDIPYGANITARNITDVIDEDTRGDIVVGLEETLENLNTMTLVAKDTIEVTELFLKFGIEAVKLICHRLNVAGVINATGSLFIDTDELIINNNLSNIADTSLNLYINAKKATFGSGGNITVNSPRTEGYDEVDIDIANAPTQGYISLDGRLNSLVKIDEIKGSFVCYLNEQNADLTLSDRRLLEMSKIYDAYAAADGTDGNYLPLSGGTVSGSTYFSAANGKSMIAVASAATLIGASRQTSDHFGQDTNALGTTWIGVGGAGMYRGFLKYAQDGNVGDLDSDNSMQVEFTPTNKGTIFARAKNSGNACPETQILNPIKASCDAMVQSANANFVSGPNYMLAKNADGQFVIGAACINCTAISDVTLTANTYYFVYEV